MIKFVSALAGSPFLAKAQERVGQARYKEAILALRSLGRVLGCDIASEKMPLRANIIAFQASYWLNDIDTLKRAALISVNQSLRFSSKNSGSKERYTAAYLYGLCEFAAGRFPDQGEYFLKLATRLSQTRFDYKAEEVPKKFFAEMPLGAKEIS